MGLKEKYMVLKDRLRALFALSIKEHDEKGECLTVDELAALIDGGSTPQKRDALLLHLDACPSCYNEWLAATAILSDEEKKGDVQPDLFKKDGFFRKYKAPFASAVAIAASLIIFIYYIVYNKPSVSSMINRQYTIAFVYNLSFKNTDLLKDSDIHSDKSLVQTYGFTGSSNTLPSPSAKSFISGFQTGRTMLIERTKPSEKREDTKTDYYWAGRWFALLSSVCESNEKIPGSFWEMQQQTIDVLAGVFNRHAKNENEAVILARSMDRINTEIDQKKSSACHLINSELKFILEGINLAQ